MAKKNVLAPVAHLIAFFTPRPRVTPLLRFTPLHPIFSAD